jgi:hypothetical protein
MSIMLALLSSVLLGSADFAGGVAARRAPAVAITVWANAVGLMTALVVVLVLTGRLSLTDAGWGMLAGTFGSLGAVLLARVMLRERLRGLQRLGTAMAMGSVLLLAIR